MDKEIEELLSKNLATMVKSVDALGGVTVLFYQANDKEKGMGVACQVPTSLRPVMPTLFRDIAFQFEKQNLMNGIKTEELENATCEVLKSETVKRRVQR